MTRRMFLAALASLPALALATEPRGDYMQQVVRGNTVFAGDLFGQMRAKSGNLFCSPYSISAALGMTAAGARGPTAEEMTKVLHLQAGNVAHLGFAELQQSLQAKKDAGYELSIANALWGQQGFPFDPKFLDIVGKNYGGGLKSVDFAKAAVAAGTINKWVEEQTKNRIKNLIDPSMVNANTRLVLTNAIYFKGQWQDKFRKESTTEQPFFTTASDSVPVPMMHQGGRYRYYQDDNLKLVELPYAGDRLAMTLIVPLEKQALARQVEARLTEENLNRWLNAAAMKKGDIAVPKFEFETKYELTPALQAMGMRQAFTDAADFSGMTTAAPLKISFVVHKAFIKVDEEGSEAAAATGVGMKLAAAPIDDRFQFRADQPFVFMIRDRQTGSVLFLGRVANPKG